MKKPKVGDYVRVVHNLSEVSYTVGKVGKVISTNGSSGVNPYIVEFFTLENKEVKEGDTNPYIYSCEELQVIRKKDVLAYLI